MRTIPNFKGQTCTLILILLYKPYKVMCTKSKESNL